MSEMQSNMTRMFDEGASVYESLVGHGLILPGESSAWAQDILEQVSFIPGVICLDAACGTGVITRMLADWVGDEGHVIATDASITSLQLNQERLPSSIANRVSFVHGDLHDRDLLKGVKYSSFDYIVCRQGMCLLEDPMTVFEHWHNWLKVGGKLIILDALYVRDDWSTIPEWAEMIDKLPFSCLQTIATLPYLLGRAGFAIDWYGYLNRVNAAYAEAHAETGSPRYMVIAHKAE